MSTVISTQDGVEFLCQPEERNETNLILSSVTNHRDKRDESNNSEVMKHNATTDFLSLLNEVNSVEQMDVFKRTLISLKPQIDVLKDRTLGFVSTVKNIDTRKKIDPQRKFKIKSKKQNSKLALKPAIEESHEIKISAILKSNGSS